MAHYEPFSARDREARAHHKAHPGKDWSSNYDKRIAEQKRLALLKKQRKYKPPPDPSLVQKVRLVGFFQKWMKANIKKNEPKKPESNYRPPMIYDIKPLKHVPGSNKQSKKPRVPKAPKSKSPRRKNAAVKHMEAHVHRNKRVNHLRHELDLLDMELDLELSMHPVGKLPMISSARRAPKVNTALALAKRSKQVHSARGLPRKGASIRETLRNKRRQKRRLPNRKKVFHVPDDMRIATSKQKPAPNIEAKKLRKTVKTRQSSDRQQRHVAERPAKAQDIVPEVLRQDIDSTIRNSLEAVEELKRQLQHQKVEQAALQEQLKRQQEQQNKIIQEQVSALLAQQKKQQKQQNLQSKQLEKLQKGQKKEVDSLKKQLKNDSLKPAESKRLQQQLTALQQQVQETMEEQAQLRVLQEQQSSAFKQKMADTLGVPSIPVIPETGVKMNRTKEKTAPVPASIPEDNHAVEISTKVSRPSSSRSFEKELEEGKAEDDQNEG